MRVNPRSSYGWNEQAGRYVNQTTGRFVPFTAVKSELEAVVSASQQRMAAVSQQLIDRQITVKEWQLAMAREIKEAHIASAAASKGGWAQMTQSDWGWTGAKIKEQYQYLKNFANEIASGKQKLDGRLMVRAEMYGAAQRTTFEEMRRRYERNKGLTEERRILGPAEHCTSSGDLEGCLELASKGWQPIGTLPRIGQSPCRVNCKCTFEFR